MTYFLTYINSTGTKHTVHEIPEAQLKSIILSLSTQGATNFHLWQSVELALFSAAPVIVGKIL